MAATGVAVGAGLALGAATVAGSGPWNHHPYCKPVAGMSSAVQVLVIGGTTPKPVPLPPKTETVCATTSPVSR